MTLLHGPWLDRSVQALVQGYRFGEQRFARSGADRADVRLLGRPTVLLRGAQAARFFYESGALVRSAAAPRRMRRTLIGDGGVQTLDGHEHQHRRQLFLQVTEPERVAHLVDRFVDLWRAEIPHWQAAGEVVLLDAVGRLLTEAVTDWAGCRTPEAAPGLDPVALHRDLRLLVESGARLGPTYRRGRSARHRLEQQFAHLVIDVRRGIRRPGPETALHEVAWWRDRHGAFLHEDVAAVELLNVVRPVVAVDRYITFCALALHDHGWAFRDDADDEHFVDEVRRYYPFFPMVLSRASAPTEWGGRPIAEGDRVVLDLYATDHSSADWTEPDRFDPARFASGTVNPWAFVPQGGGDVATSHRCPGEGVARALMLAATRILTRELSYRLPPQDLSVPLGRMPAAPASGLVLTDVRLRGATAATTTDSGDRSPDPVVEEVGGPGHDPDPR